MIITNQEKQILQKYYAERTKSLSQNLKDLIQQDKQDGLAADLIKIKESSKRICEIQNEWRNDNQKELQKLEQEVEDGYENNSDTDIDVLTNFQPMPKRFIVWDKQKLEFVSYDSNLCFVRDDDNNLCLCDIDWWAQDLVEVESSRYISIQSTNLFDKDGKEIFEGSIIEDSEGDVGVIEFENSQWAVNWESGKFVSYRVDQNDTDGFKCIGHILSNPELLEEK